MTLFGFDLTEYFISNWSIYREISSGELMIGEAEFQKTPTGEIAYQETVMVTLRNGLVVEGNQNYIFDISGNLINVYFQGTPKRKFQSFQIKENYLGFSAQSSHLCGNDTYYSKIILRDEKHFCMIHSVEGPRKGYQIKTWLQRRS